MQSSLTICCPCHFGLESVLSYEVKKIGGQNIQVADGRVTFEGAPSLVARSNLWLRTAERVCIVLGTFQATTFTQLFDEMEKLPLEEFVGINDAFPVKGWSLKSQLFSISDCQSILKKAAVKRLEKVYGQSWFEETGPVHQIQFSIMKDEVTIMLDTSGTGLHKRGYRRDALEAPIKETLAAGIADLAHIRKDALVIDPMCGSGTLLIESALRAYNIAPGIHRHFAAESWDYFDASIWKDERKAALSAIDRTSGFHGIGYDLDKAASDLTRANAVKAGIGSKIEATMRGLAQFTVDAEQAVILCNPPYGERMMEIKETEDLYRLMGRVFPKRKGLSYYIITPHEDFEDLFGRKADKRRKLYNGMIKCQLFMYYN
ncbi:class I SAM-dependent RNA methyltransferase [Oscillospiraceae bacterium MB08-C2-2]|nr:class I SAM-dependent RNA methyltransferase [Oscillospiraceae bacterium MB08-C2-2]